MDEFHAAVYDIVRAIPVQKVTTYGHIAKLVGKPTYSRYVGQALKWLSPDTTPPVPWHRVISSAGTISSRGPGTQGAEIQRDALETEGVEVTVSRMGEFRIDLRTWGWFPDRLDGAGEDQEQDDGNDEDEDESTN